jgi:hypothetical protein
MDIGFYQQALFWMAIPGFLIVLLILLSVFAFTTGILTDKHAEVLVKGLKPAS